MAKKRKLGHADYEAMEKIQLVLRDVLPEQQFNPSYYRDDSVLTQGISSTLYNLCGVTA